MKRKLIIAAILILASVFVLNYRLQNTKVDIKGETSEKLTQDAFATAREKYITLLEKQDPRAALSLLREDIKTNDSLLRSCHDLTHELGHHAYDTYKDFAKAVSYKDEICNSGYLHGIIEMYFMDSDDLTRTLQTVCASYKEGGFLSWECYHGVGHGIMYFTSNDLPKSISLCDTYKNSFARESCVNGVFMENFATQENGMHTSKYTKPEDPFYPCKEQAENNKDDCYLYAPTYYLSLNPNKYTEALSWCETAEDEFYKLVCASGVGGQAIKENINNPAFVESVCMNSHSKLQSVCIRGMVSLYINHFGALEPAQNLCTTLETQNKKTCEQTVEASKSLFQTL